MKLTRRGRRLVFTGYVVAMLFLVYLIITKPTQCIDEYTANSLATQFLYGEGDEVDNAIQAIYNNGGWIEVTNNNEEVLFPCMTESVEYDEIEF